MKKKLLRLLMMVSKFTLYGALLQFVCLSFVLAYNSDAQQISSVKDVEIEVEFSHSDMMDVISKIESQTGFQFVYYSPDFKRIKDFNLSKQKITVADLLMKLSENYQVAFRQVNNSITIRKLTGRHKNNSKPLEINLQGITVTGKVISSEDQEGLPGVNVVVKGTTQGTVTDVDGNYQINVPSNQTILSFSSVGFVTKEVTVGEQSVINISLAPDVQSLQEIVVIGYGTQKKTDITGSIATMDAEKLNERPINRVDQALVGQMSGVRVKQTSGIPGRGFSIQVRGTGSISANNEPLYVVDGFPLEVSPQTSSGGFDNGNPLTNLNPDDIESIQVLKDAASASIYGSRGSNGVVLITTKQGKTGKPQISFNSYVGWNETVKKLDVLSSQEYVDRWIEHENYFWVRDYGSKGATSSQTDDERRTLYNTLNPGNQIGPNEYLTQYMWDPRWLEPGHPGLDYVDWQDLFFRKGLVQSYQLSANGGNDITKYYVSGDYLNQEGIAIGVNYQQYSARANVEVQPSKAIKFGLNLSPSYSILEDPGVEGKDALTHIVVGMNPVVESSTGALGTNVGDNVSYAWGTSRVSPIAEAMNVDRSTKTFRAISTAYAEINILKDLRFKTSVNFDIHNSNSYRFTLAFITRNRAASGARSGYTRINFVNENTLNYVKTFGKHNLDILAGYSYSTFKFDDFSISGTGFASDDVPTLNAASSTSGTSSERKNVLISYFGRAQYNYADKYLFQASIRRDGSSKFGDNTKWGVFPSFSAGWRLSEEQFMQDVSLISDLKLRASWGLAGNNGVGDYDQVARLIYANYSYGGTLVNGQVPDNFPNPDLSWETSRTLDFGFDAGILENRIYASFDYYTKRNVDLLLNIPVPTASGFSTALTNIGEVLNKGWEVELNTRNTTGVLGWNTQINFSHNTNEVVKLGPNDTPILGGAFDITHNILEVGKPMYTIYVVQQDGLLTSDDIANGYPTYGSEEAGDPKYVDINNDGTIDANDRTYSGHPDPDYIWGITNSFNYKGFDLSILIQGQWGGVIYSTFGRAMYRTGQGATDNMLGKARNRVMWVEGQELTDADVAGKERKSPSTFGRIKNTDWLYPNDYWRIRNITLGYDLGKLFQSNVVRGARIYITAENWFGGDKYDCGFNPEAVNNSGDDYGAFPLSRSMILGVNLKF